MFDTSYKWLISLYDYDSSWWLPVQVPCGSKELEWLIITRVEKSFSCIQHDLPLIFTSYFSPPPSVPSLLYSLQEKWLMIHIYLLDFHVRRIWAWEGFDRSIFCYCWKDLGNIPFWNNSSDLLLQWTYNRWSISSCFMSE